MRVRTNRIYPYPVLNNNVDDFVYNKFEVLKDIEYDSEVATVVLNTTIEDKNIISFLKENKVGLFCNIECSTTKYRYMFEIPFESLAEYRYDLDITRLNDNIELVCMLVTKDEINFTSDDLSEFYKNEDINYPKYSVIGYTDTDEISLIKQLDTNGDIPSIFGITSSETSKEIHYDNTEHQIKIFLPREQYDVYYDSRGTCKRLKQMLVNLPVLESVLNDVKSDDSVGEGLGWYKVLEGAIERMGYSGFEDPAFKNESSLKIAQNLLGDVLKDAFEEFENLRTKGE